MTASKLALHVLPGSDDVTALVKSAKWAAVKAVNRVDVLAVARDAGIAVRILRDTGTDSAGSADAVNRLWNYDLSAVTVIQPACESARSYDPVWQGEVLAGLRARGFGGVVLLGGFATGNPTQVVDTPNGPHFPELEPLYPLLRLSNVALALDEYTGVLATDPRAAAWWPWTAQRHRLIVADLARQGIAVPVYVTESGGDNAAPATSGGGWRTRGWSAQQYAATLCALDDGDRADAALVCRCLFASAPTSDWSAYDIAPIGTALAAWVTAHAKAPQSLPDSPGSPIAPPSAPEPIVKIGHAMPAPIFAYDQGWTKDCWLRCTEAFFFRYGYAVSVDQIFQAAKGKPYPPGGEAATFAEVETGIRALAVQLGVKLQLAEFDDPPTVWNALHDADTANPWTIIIGVEESVLQAGQQYGHFMVLDKDLGNGNVHVVDSYGHEDGDSTGVYPWSLIAQAMVASWEPTVDAIGVKIIPA